MWTFCYWPSCGGHCMGGDILRPFLLGEDSCWKPVRCMPREFLCASSGSLRAGSWRCIPFSPFGSRFDMTAVWLRSLMQPIKQALLMFAFAGCRHVIAVWHDFTVLFCACAFALLSQAALTVGCAVFGTFRAMQNIISDLMVQPPLFCGICTYIDIISVDVVIFVVSFSRFHVSDPLLCPLHCHSFVFC